MSHDSPPLYVTYDPVISQATSASCASCGLTAGKNIAPPPPYPANAHASLRIPGSSATPSGFTGAEQSANRRAMRTRKTVFLFFTGEYIDCSDMVCRCATYGSVTGVPCQTLEP